MSLIRRWFEDRWPAARWNAYRYADYIWGPVSSGGGLLGLLFPWSDFGGAPSEQSADVDACPFTERWEQVLSSSATMNINSGQMYFETNRTGSTGNSQLNAITDNPVLVEGDFSYSIDFSNLVGFNQFYYALLKVNINGSEYSVGVGDLRGVGSTYGRFYYNGSGFVQLDINIPTSGTITISRVGTTLTVDVDGYSANITTTTDASTILQFGLDARSANSGQVQSVNMDNFQVTVNGQPLETSMFEASDFGGGRDIQKSSSLTSWPYTARWEDVGNGFNTSSITDNILTASSVGGTTGDHGIKTVLPKQLKSGTPWRIEVEFNNLDVNIGSGTSFLIVRAQATGGSPFAYSSIGKDTSENSGNGNVSYWGSSGGNPKYSGAVPSSGTIIVRSDGSNTYVSVTGFPEHALGAVMNIDEILVMTTKNVGSNNASFDIVGFTVGDPTIDCPLRVPAIEASDFGGGGDTNKSVDLVNFPFNKRWTRTSDFNFPQSESIASGVFTVVCQPSTSGFQRVFYESNIADFDSDFEFSYDVTISGMEANPAGPTCVLDLVINGTPYNVGFTRGAGVGGLSYYNSGFTTWKTQTEGGTWTFKVSRLNNVLTLSIEGDDTYSVNLGTKTGNVQALKMTVANTGGGSGTYSAMTADISNVNLISDGNNVLMEL